MDRTLFKLSKKLELATGLNITSKYASTPYQVTNYGLGGLCETHVDPHGYLDGNVELPPNRKNLVNGVEFCFCLSTTYTYTDHERRHDWNSHGLDQ